MMRTDIQPTTLNRGTTVLVVDDELLNHQLIHNLLQADGYRVLHAECGRAALQCLAGENVDLILLDIMMPELDGFEVIQQLKESSLTRAIPVIMVTALDDRASRLRALELGAEEFITKPIDTAELRARVRNLIKLKAYSDLLAGYTHRLEGEVQERTARLNKSQRDTIFTMTRAAEFRDEETGAHVLRISDYAAELASELGMPADFVDRIYYASPMHDVGKIGIPDKVLLKPSPLNAREWAIMKTHCHLGRSILSGSDSPYLIMGAEIAYSHHERWDGSGYPEGLKGEAIPLSGRIMSLCDVYDALRSCRPYKKGIDHATTLAILSRGDERTQPAHFDPQILSAFVHCAARFEEIFERHTQARSGYGARTSAGNAAKPFYPPPGPL